jgi:hypothetical protein
MDNGEKEENFWTYYKKDNGKVKERLLEGDYDKASMTGLGNFDGLFCFLNEIGFFPLFDFRPDCRQRVMIPLVYVLSTYGLKVISQLDSLNSIDDQLFKDRGVLEMVGFTGVHFKGGFSNRNKGKHLPFNISTMGKLFGDFSTVQTDDFFTSSFQPLFRNKFVPAGTYIMDATPLYVSNSAKTYENTGTIVKDGKKKKGYKLITLKYARKNEEKSEPEIFVAAILVPLNRHESRYMIPVVEQAISNIGKGRIKQIVLDRGFVDGENLYKLKYDYNIDFIIYSKSNMDVTDELKKKAEEYKARKQKKLPLPAGYFQQEDKDTRVYGFNNLKWFWTYGKSEHQEEVKKKLYKKEKTLLTHPISGGIITKYKGKDVQIPITFLSSKRFGKSFTPMIAVKLYKKRHYTENEGYRELKQGYKIGKFPSRKFNGIYLHAIFTLVMFNYITCFKTSDGRSFAYSGLKRLSRGFTYYGAIIYSQPYFGVFDLEEVLGWFGLKGKGLRAPPFLKKYHSPYPLSRKGRGNVKI